MYYSLRYALQYLYRSAAIATTNDAHSDDMLIFVAAPANTAIGDGAPVAVSSDAPDACPPEPLIVEYPGLVALAFHPAEPPTVGVERVTVFEGPEPVGDAEHRVRVGS
jgi:hypothetical protein